MGSDTRRTSALPSGFGKAISIALLETHSLKFNRISTQRMRKERAFAFQVDFPARHYFVMQAPCTFKLQVDSIQCHYRVTCDQCEKRWQSRARQAVGISCYVNTWALSITQSRD